MTNLPTQTPLQGALEFAHAIEQARQIMLSAPWYLFSDSQLQEQAAAERQLKHQISAALDEGFIVHNPDHPEFRTMTQHNQYGLCNPGYNENLTSPITISQLSEKDLVVGKVRRSS